MGPNREERWARVRRPRDVRRSLGIGRDGEPEEDATCLGALLSDKAGVRACPVRSCVQQPLSRVGHRLETESLADFNGLPVVSGGVVEFPQLSECLPAVVKTVGEIVAEFDPPFLFDQPPANLDGFGIVTNS